MILLIIFIYLLTLIINNKENFINFKLPGNGYWCDKNNIDCNYPTIAIFKPTKNNKNYITSLYKKDRILPYHTKNNIINPLCYKCILNKDNENCIFFSINSHESIIKLSKKYIEWISFIDKKEFLTIIKKKQFNYNNKNIYILNKTKAVLLLPGYIENDENISIADIIVNYKNHKYVSIEFYIFILIIYYKAHKISENIYKNESYKINYTIEEKTFILNHIKNIIKDIKFNKINDNYREKQDEFYELCNNDLLTTNNSESDYIKNINNEINKNDENYLNFINLLHDTIDKKNKINNFNMNTYDKQQKIKLIKKERKELFKKYNLENEFEPFQSADFNNIQNGVIKIKNVEYLFSYGLLFIKNNDNLNKLIRADKYGHIDEYKPDKTFVLPNDLENYNNVYKNFKIYDNIDMCSVIENENTTYCKNTIFSYEKNNFIILDQLQC